MFETETSTYTPLVVDSRSGLRHQDLRLLHKEDGDVMGAEKASLVETPPPTRNKNTSVLVHPPPSLAALRAVWVKAVD